MRFVLKRFVLNMSLIVFAGVLIVGSSIHAASPIAVGEEAPAFTLKNQAGDDTSLESLVKQKPVALIFYRSADW